MHLKKEIDGLIAQLDKTATVMVFAATNPFVRKLNPNSKLPEILRALDSALTDYDKKLQSKQPNDYRLDHFLKSVDTFKKSVKSSDSPAEMKEKAYKIWDKRSDGKLDLLPINQIGKKLGWF